MNHNGRRDGTLEELVLYVPGLETQFYKRKKLRYRITQLSRSISNTANNISYIKEERKLYLSSVAVGTMEFQSVLFDFEHNKITFKGREGSPGDIHHELYELLTSIKLEFQPIQMAFRIERNPKR